MIKFNGKIYLLVDEMFLFVKFDRVLTPGPCLLARNDLDLTSEIWFSVFRDVDLRYLTSIDFGLIDLVGLTIFGTIDLD